MPYAFKPSVVVARRGAGSGPVFLTEQDGWTAEIRDAELIEDEAHGDIRLIEAQYRARGMSEVRLATVRLGPAGPVLEGADAAA
jgi:hypothetical protein